jgi:hypothetical protein
MWKRKYGKKGLGLITITFMTLFVTILLLFMNVAAHAGNFRCVYIEYTEVKYGDTYNDLEQDDFVNGTFENAQHGTPTFKWRLNLGSWHTITNVAGSGGVYDFNFNITEDPGLGGTLWIEATDGPHAIEWHCYYT